MSGSPVLDVKGRVVAIHGMTDVAEIQERIQNQARINHFKWGIPIHAYQKTLPKLRRENAKKLVDKADRLWRNGQYTKALGTADKAIAF